MMMKIDNDYMKMWHSCCCSYQV